MSVKCVLIVDDSIFIAERLKFMLREPDNACLVRHAANFSEAILIVEEIRPAIVLLDIQLPGRSGIELLQYIKTNYPAIIVIMLTNQSGEYYKQICKNLGAAYFFDKSKDFELIPGIISSIP